MEFKEEKHSILNICMYLELYTESKYSHDDVECDCFSKACIEVLKKCNALEENAELINRLNEFKGMSCREIGEEKCNELFSIVKNIFNHN